MTVKLSPASMLAFVVGLGFLVFMLSGKDLSPRQSVSDSPHSVVNASSASAFEANRSSLRSPDPSQVVVVQPPVVNVVVPVSPTGGGTSVGSGDTGWRTPAPVPVEEDEDSSSDAKPASAKAKTGKPSASSSSAPDCDALAQRIHDTHDYTGSPDEFACFGHEDDPRVALALDYGQTEQGYAASEQTLKPGSYGCMLVADGIVADGWQGTQEQVDCFGYDDLAGINDAYGALENGQSSY